MADKTYAETRGEAPFDWNKELMRIREGGDLTVTEHCKLSDKAMSWVTCACGNECAIIPRDKDGRPADPTLLNLGGRFGMHVVYEEWEAASRTLAAAIEARSDVLIAEELAKLNATT